MGRGGECSNSARLQKPASPCEIEKTHSIKRCKLLTLVRTEYLVPKKAQTPSPR